MLEVWCEQGQTVVLLVSPVWSLITLMSLIASVPLDLLHLPLEQLVPESAPRVWSGVYSHHRSSSFWESSGPFRIFLPTRSICLWWSSGVKRWSCLHCCLLASYRCHFPNKGLCVKASPRVNAVTESQAVGSRVLMCSRAWLLLVYSCCWRHESVRNFASQNKMMKLERC